MSNFSMTLPQLVLGSSCFFLNLFCTMIAGLALNVISILKYKSHVIQRRDRERIYRNKGREAIGEATTSAEVPRKLTQKEINENKAETNLFYMSLTLSCISILSRIVMIFSIVFLFFDTFSSFLDYILIHVSICTIVPTVSIFIFYFFNKMFRDEFNRKVLRKSVASDVGT
jgi:hypothetical protein